MMKGGDFQICLKTKTLTTSNQHVPPEHRWARCDLTLLRSFASKLKARCLSGLSYYPIVGLWVKAEAKTPRACSRNISVPGLLLHQHGQHGHGVQHSFHQRSTSSRGPPTCVRSDHAGQDPGQWKIVGTCWNLIWLVVYLPLWKIWVSWDDSSQYMEE